MLLLQVETSWGKLVGGMKFGMMWLVVAAWGGVGGSGKDDLDRVIDVVYNPSAGPFQ